MTHKINYTVVERVSPISKKHYVTSQVVSTGTLTFEDVCAQACEGNTLDPVEVQAAVKIYMHTAQRLLLRGWRVPLGSNFLTLYPKLELSVTDKEGKKAKKADVKVKDAHPTLGCTVSSLYSKKFRTEAAFQRVDLKGKPVPEPEEDINDDNKKGKEENEGPVAAG